MLSPLAVMGTLLRRRLRKGTVAAILLTFVRSNNSHVTWDYNFNLLTCAYQNIPTTVVYF